MNDNAKTKEQLIAELRDLRVRLEESEACQEHHDNIVKEFHIHERTHKSILDSVPAMIWYKDTENRILRANAYAAASVGKSIDEVEGKSVYDLYPEHAQEYHDDDLEVIHSGRPKAGIIESYKSHDNEIRWVRTNKVPLRDENGKIEGVIVVSVDITEFQETDEKLRQTHRFLDSVIENIPLMVFVKDAKELRFVFLNTISEEYLGYSVKDLIGNNDYDFFPQDEADFFTEKDREVLATGKLLDIPEEPILNRAGEERLLHTKKIPIFDDDGNPQYLLGISEDITDKREAEHRIRTLQGLLPICARCKNIRDDKGYWRKIESYFSENSDIMFTHGYCPDCFEKYMGELKGTVD